MNHEKLDSNNVEDVMVLTEMQKSMLYHYVADIHTTDYFEQTSYDLTGKLDMDALIKCWNEVAKENEMLRTVFRWIGIRMPVQVTLKSMDIPVLLDDFSHVPVEERQKKLLEIMKRERQKGIDLAKHPFWVNFLNWDVEYSIMIINCHHIITDGWSNAILLNEFFRQYLKLTGEEQPSIIRKGKYKEYVKWMVERDKEEEKSFWRNCLQGYLSQQAAGRQKSGKQSKVRYSIPLAEEQRKQLYRFAEEKEITLSCLLYSAWALLIHLVEKTDDIVFGTTVSGRPPEVENVDTVLGLFINTVFMRVSFYENQTIADLLEKNSEFMLNRREFEYASISEISDYCGNLSLQELLKYVVVIQNYPVSKELLTGTGLVKIELNERFYKSEVEMLLGIRVFNEIIFDFDYNSSVFSDIEVERLADDYISILSQITATDSMEVDTKPLSEIQITGTYFTNNEENAVFNDIVDLESVDFD